MTYSAYTIFNTILSFSKKDDIKIDVMKAHMLVYFCHGFYLSFTKKPLLNEDIQISPIGFCIPSLYYYLEIQYGTKKVNNYVELYDHILSKNTISYVSKIEGCKFDLFNLIKDIWNEYKHLSGIQLCNYSYDMIPNFDDFIKENTVQEVQYTKIDNQFIMEIFDLLVDQRK